MTRTYLTLMTAVIALALGSVSQAAMTASIETSISNTVIDTTSLNTDRWDVKSDRQQTQTFTLDSATDVDAFAFFVNRGGSFVDAEGTSLKVFEVSAVDGDPLNITNTLLDEALPVGFDFTGDDKLLVLDIDDLNLAAGSYAVQLNSTGSFPFVRWKHDLAVDDQGDPLDPDSYTGGAAYYDDGGGSLVPGGGNSGDPNDRAFAVIAVPEPASVALLGLGGLALLRRRSA